MRPILLLLLAGLLIMAACAPEEASPTAALPEATLEPTAPIGVVVTRAPVDEAGGDFALPEAGVGTLVASETEDPNAGLIFDRVRLTRSGGPRSEEGVVLEIFQNGSYTRNGASGSISQQEVARLDALLDEINFFGLQGNMLGPSGEDPAYRFTLTVVRGADERTIQSQDGWMPQAYIQLLAEFFEVGMAGT